MICHQIHKAFPDDPIVAEESPKELLKPERADSLKLILDYVKEEQEDADESKIIEWIGYGTGHVSKRYWTLDPIGKEFSYKENLKFFLYDCFIFRRY